MGGKCAVNSCDRDYDLNIHHVVPKFTFPDSYSLHKKWDMFENESNRIILCEKHHNVLHLLISKIIWNNRSMDDLVLQRHIKKYTSWFLNKWR